MVFVFIMLLSYVFCQDRRYYSTVLGVNVLQWMFKTHTRKQECLTLYLYDY